MLVVENEISYLAFPGVPDAVAIFGEGFGLATLERVRWLHDKELVYWGDIDTHGFVMLDRLRTGFPTVRSILMDHETLLAHPTQLVKEPEPTNVPLPHLTDPGLPTVNPRHLNNRRLRPEASPTSSLPVTRRRLSDLPSRLCAPPAPR